MGDSLDSKAQCVMCIYTLQKISKLTDFSRECPDSINIKRYSRGKLWTPDVSQLNNLNTKLKKYLEKSRNIGTNILPKLIERVPRQPSKKFDPIQQEPIERGEEQKITQDIKQQPYQHPNYKTEIFYNLPKDLINNETQSHLDFLSNISQNLSPEVLLNLKGTREQNQINQQKLYLEDSQKGEFTYPLAEKAINFLQLEPQSISQNNQELLNQANLIQQYNYRTTISKLNIINKTENRTECDKKNCTKPRVPCPKKPKNCTSPNSTDPCPEPPHNITGSNSTTYTVVDILHPKLTRVIDRNLGTIHTKLSMGNVTKHTFSSDLPMLENPDYFRESDMFEHAKGKPGVIQPFGALEKSIKPYLTDLKGKKVNRKGKEQYLMDSNVNLNEPVKELKTNKEEGVYMGMKKYPYGHNSFYRFQWASEQEACYQKLFQTALDQVCQGGDGWMESCLPLWQEQDRLALGFGMFTKPQAMCQEIDLC